MSRRTGTGAMPWLRAALIDHLRRFQVDGRMIFADKIAVLEAGTAVVLSTEQMFFAVHSVDPESATKKYAYRTDPGNQRRFLLGADDTVTELPPEGP